MKGNGDARIDTWPGAGTGLTREMDRLFERFFESPWPDVPALGDWTPALHVSEGKDAISVKAELPGVDAKDIAVSLDGDVRAPASPGGTGPQGQDDPRQG